MPGNPVGQSDERGCSSGMDRYGYSTLTDSWYLLHDWEDLGDGKVRAKGKTEVAREEVPQEWLDATEERGGR